eukprot:3592427-Lingulodinium_polyedra.AAC.1
MQARSLAAAVRSCATIAMAVGAGVRTRGWLQESSAVIAAIASLSAVAELLEARSVGLCSDQ